MKRVNPARLPINSWVSALRRSRQRIRVAFAVIVVFLFAQVIWWVVFQQQYIHRTVQQTTQQWTQEAELAQLALRSTTGEARAAILERIAAQREHLNVNGDLVSVNPAALELYRDRQERYLRMFAYEVPFFLLVMLSGLYVIALSVRSDFELRRRQQNFLLAATHEFRTPISTLRLLVETAQYRELSREKQLEVLERMNNEVSRLNDVSERVLATARLEQGVAAQGMEERDLNAVTAQILEEQRTKLEGKGARISLEVADAPLFVNLDPSAFSIVLGNLLDNAVKYTSTLEKPVMVRLEAHTGRAELRVEDRGIGIAAHEIPHVFDQFYRVGNELTRTAKGLGLGLYLVRGITELMGGSVTCDALETGTRFTVTLPLSRAPAAQGERKPRDFPAARPFTES
jgi:signal transduction histidine kinase